MAKTLELKFALAGKLAPSFTNATKEASEQLCKMDKQVKKISAAAQKRQDAAAFKGLAKAAEDAKKSFASLGKEIAGTALIISGTIAAVGGTIYGIATSAASSADAAIKSAQSVGMATSSFTELSYAAKMAGVSEQEFVSSSSRLAKTVQDALGGNEKAIEAFARAGVTLRDSEGNLKTTDQLYGDLADTFASMPDGIGKTALAMTLFGESGTKLIPLFNGGRAAIEQLRKDARRLGISLSEADAKNAEAFNDSFANIGESMRGVSLIIGKVLWPVLTKVHTAISEWIATNGQLLAQNLPEWIEEIEKEIAPLRVELDAAWESIKSGARDVNAMVQSMGGWIPVIKKMAEYWLYYRGLRIGVSLFQTTRSVFTLGKSFVETLPAMGRWISNMGVKSVWALSKFASASGAVFEAFTNIIWYSLRGIAALGKFAVTISVKVVGAIASFASSIWKSLIPALTRMGRSLWSGVVAMGKFIVAMAAKGVAAVTSFGSTAIAAIIPALSSIAAGLGAAAVAAYGFAAALLANPLTWIVVGIAAVTAAVIWCCRNWDTITAAVSAAWETIKSVFVAGWNMLPGWIQEPILQVVADVEAFGGKLLSVFSTAWDAIAGFFGRRADAVGEAFDKGFINGLMEAVWQFSPVAIFSDIFKGLVEWLGEYDIVSAAKALIIRFGEGLMSAWESIKGSIASAIVDFIPGGEKILNVAASGADLLKSGASSVGSAMGNAYDSVAGLFHANGGIFTTPHVGMVAEAGPEAIVPLNRPNRARDIMGTAASMLGVGRGRNDGVTISVSYAPTITIAGAADKGTVEQVNVGLTRSREQLRAMIREVLNDTAYNNRRLALW